MRTKCGTFQVKRKRILTYFTYNEKYNCMTYHLQFDWFGFNKANKSVFNSTNAKQQNG